ncbi:MAG: arylesterase, partial [Gammaproteobacteria bacterium]
IRSNLMAMATLALQSGAKVIMFEMDIPANYGPAYRMAFRENYATVANASGATLIPSLFEEIFANPEWLQADGIHPNEKAQPLIRDRVVSAIQSTLRAD